MAHAVSLMVALAIVWLLLSGHYDPLIVGLGAVSCVLVTWIALRMDVVDREGHPIHLTWRAPFYWSWLLWQIVKSNFTVARIIVSPSLPISPELVKVDTSQSDDLGRVIYANSITLTPGTVSIYVWSNSIEVHALTRETADDLRTGEMDRRVCGMVGE
ncbi:MAG: Na+/H+ antiporter subunit E [Kiloniellales bacterium]|nr:Na+/H+ antiporter subunit E [Kiloniellales bacterium]